MIFYAANKFEKSNEGRHIKGVAAWGACLILVCLAGFSKPLEKLSSTADNIFTAINAHADFTVANPAANIVTITETSPQATGLLTVETTDSTRLAATSETHSKAKSVASIPEGGEDQVWVIIERVINGSTVQYVEYLSSTANMDSYLTGTVNSSSTSVTSLDHLEGEKVQIVIGDAVYPPQTVTNGAVTVDIPTELSTKTIDVGLGFTSTLKTLKPEFGGQAGTSQGRKKRYNEVMVRFLNTVGATINDDQLPFRSSANAMNQGITPFTGDKEVEFRGNFETDGFIFVRQTQPLPLTVLSLYPRLVTNDG